MSRRRIEPGQTLGVMGGGQLGRMFAQAAQRMGYRVAVLDPDPASPAGAVADYPITAPYLDEQGLAQLMQRSAAITTEFENVPSGALITLGAHRPVAPGADAVAICQDRAAEKALFGRAGLAVAPHAVLEDEAALLALLADGPRLAGLLPGILKTARLGYDGKGQRGVDSAPALREAWAALGAVPCVLERRVTLAAECSVLVARDAMGEMVHLPPAVNVHRDGILAVTRVLQDASGLLSPALAAEAVAAAQGVAESMDYVGVLCLEVFVTGEGRLLANEMAPRPHNSGHWSLDGSDLSQFELQVRALAGLPLARPRAHSSAIMLNLLGDLWTDREPDWAAILALPGVHLHLYGKLQPRPGRKMGHVTITAADDAGVERQAADVARRLGLPFA